MRTRTTRDTVIICAAGVLAIALLTIPFEISKQSNPSANLFFWLILAGMATLTIVQGFRYLTARKKAQLEVTSGERYHQLADEYRRLADLAITAQEHADLKLGDLSAQMDFLREQNDSLQKILKQVE
jgi:hypothetical protein